MSTQPVTSVKPKDGASSDDRLISKFLDILQSNIATNYRRGWNEGMYEARERVAMIGRIQTSQQCRGLPLSSAVELFNLTTEELTKIAQQLEIE